MRYHNPILPGFYSDPSVCRVGGDYYLVTSTLEYFPGLPIFHSQDLIHWRQVGHAIHRPSQLDLSRADCLGGLYAPTLRHHNGWFYVACTNVNGGGHFIVKTQDPAGEWSDPLWIRLDAQHAMTFDPSLFFDDDGIAYLTYFTTDGLMQAVVNPVTGQLLTRPRWIAHAMNGFTSEGPHLYKINRRYYLMTAEGGTEYGHMESIYRADTPWGPFAPCPRNPILTHRSLHSPIQITGHGDLVQDLLGQWWMFFLAARPNGYQPVHHLGRETYLAPVVWAEDEWPVVGDNGRVRLEMEGPLPPSVPMPVPSTRDDFDRPALDLYWNFVRNPAPGSWSLTERPGHLRLRGLASTLSEIASMAFVGRRQQHFNFQASAQIEFAPASERDEAGLCLRMNEKHHYELFLSRRGGETCIVVRRTIGTLSAETACARLSASGAVTLVIRADRDWYHLGYLDDATFVELAQGETRYLATEVARGFTGVYVGLYATGNGQACSAPADFDWFDYQAGDE